LQYHTQTSKDENVVPCPTPTPLKTIESQFPYTSTSDGKTYQLTDGDILTVEGARVWIAKAARPTSVSATPAFRTIFEINGSPYTGQTIRAGARSQSNLPGSGAWSQDFIRPNQAAMESLKGVLAF
jgi:hypothetical protein